MGCRTTEREAGRVGRRQPAVRPQLFSLSRLLWKGEEVCQHLLGTTCGLDPPQWDESRGDITTAQSSLEDGAAVCVLTLHSSLWALVASVGPG